MSNFSFLAAEWPEIEESACHAESYLYTDPRSACFHARRTLELAMRWLYKADATLHLPYQDNLSALIHEPTFKQTAGETIFNKALLVARIGNRAVHDHRPVPETASAAALGELFHICYWLAHTYARGHKPDPNLSFTLPCPDLAQGHPVPAPGAGSPAAIGREVAAAGGILAERDERLTEVLIDRETSRRRAAASARGDRPGQEGRRGAARYPRLLGSRDAGPLHRSPAARGRLDGGSAGP